MTNLNDNASSPNERDASENISGSAQAVALLLKTHNEMIANLYKSVSDLSLDTKQRIVRQTFYLCAY